MSLGDQKGLPRHVGIIMDGNGRWAEERGLKRSAGHKEGLKVAKRIVSHAAVMGISCLSLYVFSTENWRRAKEETDFLMTLIKTHLRQQYDFYRKHSLRVLHSGNLDGLVDSVREEILQAEKDTSQFDGMIVNLLINYGGKDEVVRAVNRYISEHSNLGQIDEVKLRANFDQPEVPELDLLVRTGGERRLSNFMIWQAAYSELYFSDLYWPDWNLDELDNAIEYYRTCNRRFGGTD